MAAHQIGVKVTENGKVTCLPNVKTGIKRGDTIVWTGAPHSGRLEGRIRGTAAQLEAMSAADIARLPKDGSAQPLSTGQWTMGQPQAVKNDAEPGAYKYSITVEGQPPFDPVIIIVP